MSLVTGSPSVYTAQEELYIEGAPYIFFQDYRENPLNNPDGAGYYWGMNSGSVYRPQLLGCIRNVSLTEGVTMNDVRCDTVGVKDTIQKRDYVEFNLEITSMFPLAILRQILNLSAPTSSANVTTVGIGQIDNTQKYMVYAPKVYSDSAAGWLMFHLHKAKFVDAWTINFTYGEAWNVAGLKIRAYADDSKPAEQLFGVIRRADPGVTTP
jgi:hypothetical protein